MLFISLRFVKIDLVLITVLVESYRYVVHQACNAKPHFMFHSFMNCLKYINGEFRMFATHDMMIIIVQ